MNESVPNVNFLLNYVETMRGRSIDDEYVKAHREERRFYSSNKDDDYLKYVNKGSNEKLDYVEYSGNKEKSHGVFNEKGLMTSEMIKEMRTMLRNTDSPIWHGVISFTEEFGDTYCNTFEKAFELTNSNIRKNMPMLLPIQCAFIRIGLPMTERRVSNMKQKPWTGCAPKI